MSKIEILISVEANAINDIGTTFEEHSLKKDIAKLLEEKGYKKFTISGSEVLKDDTENRVVLD